MAADVIQIPLGLLREVAGDLAAAGEEVTAARTRPAVVHDAGPGQHAVTERVADVDAGLRALGDELGGVAQALVATAEDLADADRRARVRLYERTLGFAPDPSPP